MAVEGEKEGKKRSAREGYYPASESLESFALGVISLAELSSNYRQTIVATDLVFRTAPSIRRAENLGQVRRLANACIRQRNLHFNGSVCFRRC